MAGDLLYWLGGTSLALFDLFFGILSDVVVETALLSGERPSQALRWSGNLYWPSIVVSGEFLMLFIVDISLPLWSSFCIKIQIFIHFLQELLPALPSSHLFF